jgi:FixJ family two-component response regulator/signal transduction histidine kinase
MNERSSVMGQTKGGRVFPAKVTITKIKHNGQIFLAASLRDNSIYQEMEDLNREIENELAHVSRVGMLSEISNSIAHELNQPLAAILANAQTLQRLNQALPTAIDGIDPIITDLIGDTRRASQVIKRLRELLKPGPTKLSEFDLNTTVTEVEQLLKSEIIIRQVSLKLELAQDLPTVVSDRIQLQQVLINLVANAFDAFDANDSDDPQITISTRQLNPIEAIVSVVDNGTGIEPKLVQKIFDPFYSSKIEGMGMGLSISQSLLQTLGGKIWAENNSDGGASFHFTVELSNLDNEIEEIDEAESKQSKGKLEDATVFIVDDDVSVLKAMKRLINSAGYEVETFSSSEEFLQRDEYPGVGCLLIDLHMPRLSGLDLQTQLNAREYTMPIIFITGAGNTAAGVQAIKQGAMDFLTKPIDAEALLDIIASAADTDRKARAQFIRQKSTRENLSKLTSREREVLALVVKGLRNKQIAFELGINEKTVKAHRGRMMGKMEAGSIAGLVSVVESIIENPPQTR